MVFSCCDQYAATQPRPRKVFRNSEWFDHRAICRAALSLPLRVPRSETAHHWRYASHARQPSNRILIMARQCTASLGSICAILHKRGYLASARDMPMDAHWKDRPVKDDGHETAPVTPG